MTNFHEPRTANHTNIETNTSPSQRTSIRIISGSKHKPEPPVGLGLANTFPQCYGVALANSHHYQEAIKAFEGALKLDVKNEPARRAMAFCRSKLGAASENR